MISYQAGQTAKSAARFRTTTFICGTLLLVVILAVACGDKSDNSTLPTFLGAPTPAPTEAQIQDSRDVLPASTLTVVPVVQVAPPTNDPPATSETSKPAPASGRPSSPAAIAIAPTPEFATDPATASFVPDSIKLELGDQTQSVRITATGIDPRVNAFQLHLLHSSSVTIESISCLGPFDGGFVVGPAPVSDGALVGCAVIGTIQETSGEVMEIVLKRNAPGSAEVAIRESNDPGDAFFSEFVWAGDESGQQGIVGTGVLTVRD